MTLSLYPFLLSFLIYLSIGNIITRLIYPSNYKFNIFEEFFISFLIGSAVTSWILFVLKIFNINIFYFILPAAIFFIPFIFSLLLYIKNIFRQLKIKSLLSFIIFIILIFFITYDVFVSAAMVSDGFNLWGMKAKVLAADTDLLADYFQNDALIWSHLDYPLYLPTLEMLIYKLQGFIEESSVFYVVPTFYLLTGLILFYFIKKITSFVIALVLLLIFYLMPHFRLIATFNYADIPLSTYYLTSGLYFYRYLTQKVPLDKTVSLLLAANLFWIKKEGLILFIIYCLGYILFSRRYLILLLSAVPSISWLIFIKINKITSIDFLPASYTILLSNSSRLWEIPLHARRLFKFAPFWGLYWIQLFILMLLRFTTLFKKDRLYLIYLVVSPLIIYPFLFIFSAWQPYYEHLRTSLDRLILQILPLSFFLFALLLADFFPNLQREKYD